MSRAGVEPATFGFGGRRSIQLSYRDLLSRSLQRIFKHGSKFRFCPAFNYSAFPDLHSPV